MVKKAKHTPGPWQLAENDPSMILTTALDEEGNAYLIADVLTHYGAKADETRLANARLMAAAPDLLEALLETTASLVAAISLLERGGKGAAPSDKMFDMMLSDYGKAVQAGRAAILKAIGEA